MEDTRISFETAVLANQKGFDIYCGKESYFKNNEPDGWDSDRIEKPTQSLLQRWLRETHNIDISINKDSHSIYHFMINDNKSGWYQPIFNKVFESGLETILQEALKLLPNKI